MGWAESIYLHEAEHFALNIFGIYQGQHCLGSFLNDGPQRDLPSTVPNGIKPIEGRRPLSYDQSGAAAMPASTIKVLALSMKHRNHAVPLSENKHLLRWVEKMAELTKPGAIHWNATASMPG